MKFNTNTEICLFMSIISFWFTQSEKKKDIRKNVATHVPYQ